MTPFDDKIKAAEKVQQGIDTIIIDEVAANNDKVVKIQADQMYDGRRGDGTETLPKYTPYTVRMKRRRGQPSDRVTLRDTGDFQDAIVIDYGEDSFRFDSIDEKRAKLARKYGEQIFGLDDDSIDKLINLIRNEIIKTVKKIIADA